MQVTWRQFVTGYATTAAAIVTYEAVLETAVKVASVAWGLSAEQEQWVETGEIIFLVATLGTMRGAAMLRELPEITAVEPTLLLVTLKRITILGTGRRWSPVANGLLSIAGGFFMKEDPPPREELHPD